MTDSELNKEHDLEQAEIAEANETAGEELATESAEAGEETAAPEENGEDFEAKAKEWENKFLYLTAEFENFRKRIQKEKADFFKYGHEDFLREQLMVQDNFERAILAAKNTNPEKGTPLGQMVEGLEMIMWQFMESLKNQGVTPIESVGQMFDPTKHEAVAQEESKDSEPNKVLREEQKGFMLHERVLRASRVVVSKKKD